MRHHNHNRTLGRKRKDRRALLRSLAEGLIAHGKIRTTEAKAKEIRAFVEKLVSRAKTDTVASRRLIGSRMAGFDRAAKLFTEIAPRYKERAGGYTRIVKIPRRAGDGSAMAIIEFV